MHCMQGADHSTLLVCGCVMLEQIVTCVHERQSWCLRSKASQG